MSTATVSKAHVITDAVFLVPHAALVYYLWFANEKSLAQPNTSYKSMLHDAAVIFSVELALSAVVFLNNLISLAVGTSSSESPWKCCVDCLSCPASIVRLVNYYICAGIVFAYGILNCCAFFFPEKESIRVFPLRECADKGSKVALTGPGCTALHIIAILTFIGAVLSALVCCCGESDFYSIEDKYLR